MTQDAQTTTKFFCASNELAEYCVRNDTDSVHIIIRDNKVYVDNMQNLIKTPNGCLLIKSPTNFKYLRETYRDENQVEGDVRLEPDGTYDKTDFWVDNVQVECVRAPANLELLHLLLELHKRLDRIEEKLDDTKINKL